MRRRASIADASGLPIKGPCVFCSDYSRNSAWKGIPTSFEKLCSGGSSVQRLYVTCRAPRLVEQTVAPRCNRAVCELRITRGRFCGANKSGEVINVGQAVGPRLIVGLGNSIAKVGYLIGLKAVGDPHLIEVGVACKR